MASDVEDTQYVRSLSIEDVTEEYEDDDEEYEILHTLLPDEEYIDNNANPEAQGNPNNNKTNAQANPPQCYGLQ